VCAPFCALIGAQGARALCAPAQSADWSGSARLGAQERLERTFWERERDWSARFLIGLTHCLRFGMESCVETFEARGCASAELRDFGFLARGKTTKSAELGHFSLIHVPGRTSASLAGSPASGTSRTATRTTSARAKGPLIGRL